MSGRGLLRVAIVAYRYGSGFVGGAEASLRLITQTLHAAGHQVEVFATCTRAESGWTNELREGAAVEDSLPVHRFRIDPHDPERYAAAARALLQNEGQAEPAVEAEFLRHGLHSSRLLAALQAGAWDAVIAGPYLSGVTADVARALPERTLLLACLHDEPFARLEAWKSIYGRVGGILFHSAEEQRLAEVVYGWNVPGGGCIGTVIDADRPGDAARGRAVAGAEQYVVYCGRYSAEKGLPLLLDYARRYAGERPGRFTFAFVGAGDVAVPTEPWARDLGFVDEATKRDVLAGAAALVHLSRRESLSLAALEAWAQGTPVVADAGCAVLAGHLGRGAGGWAVDSYVAFAAALDDLWERPEQGQALGRQGQVYVRQQYGSRPDFTRRLEEAVRELAVPLAERMRRRGRARAAEHGRAAWRERFAAVVEDVLHRPPRPRTVRIEIRPRSRELATGARPATTLVPVRLTNLGTTAFAAEGPARWVLRSRVVPATAEGEQALDGPVTSLPELLLPGRTAAAAVPLPVPVRPGAYRVEFHAERAGPVASFAADTPPAADPEAVMTLTVAEGAGHSTGGCCGPILDAARAAAAEAHRLQRLPDDYADVTTGRLAALKRWVKRKLLGNFKHAYVDVLSRQQSAWNKEVVTALGDLAECCATLDSAVRSLAGQVEEANRRAAVLEDQLRRLEAPAPVARPKPSEGSG